MTRKIGYALRLVPLVILLCLLLTGCECKHEWQAASCDTPKTCSKCQFTEGVALDHTWADATCAAPKTCTGCGKTEGEALPHTWVDASCAAPKHCSVCKATEGEALGHSWKEATCKAPKTCSVCKATEGEALGHSWKEATCTSAKACTRCNQKEGSRLPHNWLDATTDSPQICTQCGTTTGTRIITDARFQTAFCKDLFGTWSGTIQIPGSKIIDDGFTGTLDLAYSISFRNSGGYTEAVTLKNKEQFLQNVEKYYIDTLYKDFAGKGFSQTEADAAMVATYGMDIKTYAAKAAASIDYETLFATKISGVYYANKENLYTSSSWNNAMYADRFHISGNTLTIDSLSKEYPGLVLTKS